MDYEDVIRITEGICQALDYVHQKGVIHRDLKPSNILLSKDGRPILSDFGLALITQVGTMGEVFGSPHYIAPEQAVSSAQAEPRSDLYSLGVILYEIFTGQLPFQAKDPVEVAMQHIRQPVPSPRGIRPEISTSLEAFLLKALAKEPEDRYPDGAALSAALQEAVWAPQEATRPPSTASRLSVPERVRLQSASKPLPPLKKSDPRPERVPAQEALKPDQPEGRSKAASGTSPRYLIPALIGVILFCGAGIALTCVSGLMLGARQLNLVLAGDKPTTEVTRIVPELTNTSTPVLIITATPTGPAANPYLLRIFKRRDEGFFLINEGDAEFPLGSLQLGNPPAEIVGSAWGIESLGPGECVSVKRQRAKLDQPRELECVLVGKDVEVAGRDPFWRDTFFIFYQDEFAQMCRESDEECELTIPAEP
jgi:serine/threonine protein kinase